MLKYIAVFLLAMISSVAYAEKIATVKTTGMLVPDTIQVHVFDDPSLQGVACYVTQPKRSLSISDPTDSAIACRQVGPIKGKLTSANDLYAVNKDWFLKDMRVDRIYDAKRKVMVYLVYTRKLSGDNAAHSISAVPLFGSAAQ